MTFSPEVEVTVEVSVFTQVDMLSAPSNICVSIFVFECCAQTNTSDWE